MKQKLRFLKRTDLTIWVKRQKVHHDDSVQLHMGKVSRVLDAESKHHLLSKVTVQYQKHERCEVYTGKMPNNKTKKSKERLRFRMKTLITSAMHKLIRGSRLYLIKLN